MIRKVACAMFAMTIAVGFVVAKPVTGRITDVKDNTFTFQPTKKGENVGAAVKLTLAKDGVVAKGVPDKEDKKKTVKGDAIEGGLSNKLFQNEKGVTARVTFEGTTASEVLVTSKKKDGK